MARRYRRRSTSGGVVSDTVAIANKLPWWGAALFGLVLFIVFYWLLPMWMQSKLDERQASMFRPVLEAVFGRRMHWSQWLGITLGSIGLFFAVWKYYARRGLEKRNLWGVGWLARLIARFID
jgi:drug/metabolite transporter (DMT)-like permease